MLSAAYTKPRANMATSTPRTMRLIDTSNRLKMDGVATALRTSLVSAPAKHTTLAHHSVLRSTAPRSSKWSAPSGTSFAGESLLVGGIVNRPRNVFTDAFGSSDVNTAAYNESSVSGASTTWSAPSATPPPRPDRLELSHAVTAHDLEDD